MEKLKIFITTAFIGGLIVILPIAVLVQVIQWLMEWLTNLIEPLTGLIVSRTRTNHFVAELLSLSSIFLICFVVGLTVKTAGGQWIQNRIELWFLKRIPGYTTLKEFLTQVTSQEKRAFSKPVLITFDQHKSYLFGYITAQYGDDNFAVFIPTSPSPLNGYVVQTRSESIRFLQAKPEDVMNSIIGCGVGSSEIMSTLENKTIAID